MPNNYTEAVTFVKYGPGEGGSSGESYSYSSLPLSDLYNDQDQLEVLRVFDVTTVSELVTRVPDNKEKESLYTLAGEGSGSPMYTLDTTNKKVVFNTTASNYVWKDGTHHSRGADLQLPVIDFLSNTVIVRRKTPVVTPGRAWVTGSKVTARSLNLSSNQLLSLIQEIRTYELNPTIFDFRVGSSDGICPLDENGVIPLKHISEQLGGQGILYVDLSDAEIEDLKDVNITETTLVDGHVLTWDNATQNFINAEPFSKTVDLSTSVNHSVLKWTGSTWNLSTLSLQEVNNVDITLSALETSNIIYYDATSETWKASGVVLHEGSLTNDHVLTWNYSLNKWEAKVRPDVTYEVFNLSTTSLYTMADVAQSTQATGTVEGDVLAWFDNTAFPHTWRDKSLDTWDLNNIWRGDADITDPTDPAYSGGYEFAALFHYYQKGWVMYWEPSIAQKDSFGTVRGSFHAAPLFAGPRYDDGTPHVDFANAKSNWVIKWRNSTGPDDEAKWILAGQDLNHLDDVNARYYPVVDGVTVYNQGSTEPNYGDILKWTNIVTNEHPGGIGVWKVSPGPDAVDGTIGTHLEQIKTNHRFDILVEKNNLNIGENHAAVWFDAYQVSHKKLRFNAWEMLSNEFCRCRVRVYKARYNTYSNPDNWTELTRSDLTGTNVLGWGQGGGSLARLKKRNSSSFSFTNNEVVKGDYLIFELQNFQDNADFDTNANVLHLSITWDILEF